MDSESEGEGEMRDRGTGQTTRSAAARSALRARRRARSQIGSSSTSASLPSSSAMVRAAEAGAIAGDLPSSAVFSKPLARLAATSNVGRSLSGFREGCSPVSPTGFLTPIF